MLVRHTSHSRKGILSKLAGMGIAIGPKAHPWGAWLNMYGKSNGPLTIKKPYHVKHAEEPTRGTYFSQAWHIGNFRRDVALNALKRPFEGHAS